ncbi:MAG: sporulation protein YqfD [Syntrophomonas sp.]
MANSLFDQLSGIIKIKLDGENQERVINMALSRGIYIWDIKKNREGMHLKVRASGYDALKNICDENNFNLEVIDRQGLPFFKGVFRRRLGFMLGALIFVAALYFISSFIWFVGVSGNKQVKTEKIIVTAAKYGVYQGAARWNFSRSEVEEAILSELTELAYVKVDIHGVRADIQVVEKVFPKKEITGPCNIVAEKDGIIEEVLVLEGQPQVKNGDVAARGDILISGVVFPQKSEYITEETKPEEEQPYLVRARGRVKARVNYQGYGECRLKSEKIWLTGNKKRQLSIGVGEKKFFIRRSDEKPYALFRQTSEQKTLKTPLGTFSIGITKFEEELKKTTKYTEKEAVKIAQAKAIKDLKSHTGSQKFANTKTEILSSPSDPILRIKISAETIEDIATAEPINTAENGN